MDWDNFVNIQKKTCQLSLEQPIIVGVSGGPDSLCLLNLLFLNKFNLLVIHVDHNLRPEANEEAQLVRQYCELSNIAYKIVQVDVRTFSNVEKLSLEEAARILRYRVLFEEAGKNNAQAVVVAHNANDQVETVLMHILRGAASSGLKGMQARIINPQWSNTIPLVRPLLTVQRDEILKYCEDHKLVPSHDKSNDDVTFFRNRIRLELLPIMRTYNPQIFERIQKMAEVISVEDDYLSESCHESLNRALITGNNNYLVFSLVELKKCHQAILCRIIKESAQFISPNIRDINFSAIHNAQEFILSSKKTSLEWIAGMELLKYQKDKIIFCCQRDSLLDFWPQVANQTKLSIKMNGETNINEYWCFQSQITHTINPEYSDSMQCILDGENIQELWVEAMQIGDRFSPFGMRGESLKLGDYWTNRGLPVKARKNWPIIKTNNEIAWVPGFQISEKYRVTQATKRFIIIKLIKR